MPQSILIVDDEKDMLEFLSYNLKNEGYKGFFKIEVEKRQLK